MRPIAGQQREEAKSQNMPISLPTCNQGLVYEHSPPRVEDAVELGSLECDVKLEQ